MGETSFSMVFFDKGDGEKNSQYCLQKPFAPVCFFIVEKCNVQKTQGCAKIDQAKQWITTTNEQKNKADLGKKKSDSTQNTAEKNPSPDPRKVLGKKPKGQQKPTL